MAEKVEIDIPGIGLIEAKNASTEATLLEILETLKATQKTTQQLQKNQGKPGPKQSSSSNQGAGAGGGGAGGGAGMAAANKAAGTAAKGLGVFGQAGKLAGQSVKVLGYAAGGAVGTLNGLANGAQIAAGATIAFGQKAFQAGDALTSFVDRMANVGDSTERAADALRAVPLIGNQLAGVFGAVAGAVEGVVGSFQKAAEIGATFGGSVDAMSRAAGGAGMTLDKFAGLIAQNGDSLMMLGGTTEQGAKQFAQLAKGIQQSGVGADLQRLGFTTEQINGSMAKYIGMMGKSGALQGMTTQQLVASSGEYMKQLDGLSKITGESRQALEDERKAMMAEAKVAASLQHLSAEAQGEMMTYIQSFPKAQRAAVADMIATGNTTTEAAIQFQSLLPGAAAQTMEFSRQIQAGGRISKDTMNQALNNASKEAKQSAKINSERFKYDESIQAQGGAVFELAARKTDQFSQAMGEQAKATQNANLAENLTKAKQRLSEFSNNFQLALANSGMFDSLMTSFEALANFTKEVVIPLFNVFAQAITAITPVVVSLLVPAFKALGAFIESTVIPGFTILGNWIKTAVIPIFERAYDIVSSVVGSLFSFLDVADAGTEGLGIFEEVLYTISNFIEDHLEPILIGFGVIMGTILVGKVMAFGAMMLTTLAPIASFVMGVVTMTAKLAFMAVKAAFAAASFMAINFPVLTIIAVLGTLAFVGKKLGVDFKVLGDAASYIGSLIKTVFLGAFKGILGLLNKIPGMRGDFDDSIKGVDESLAKESEKRNQLADDMGKRMADNRAADKAASEKAAADEKAATDAAAAATAAATAAAAAGNTEVSAKQAADNAKAAKRQEDREARKAKREQDNIDRKKKAELDAVSARSAADKKAVDDKKSEEDAKKDETNPSVSMSDPIAMLKSFAAQQKSAFTQEAKALEDKEKARSELKMASQEQVKAMEEASKATSAEEKKAAEARITEAEARLAKASELNKKADDEVNKALERMKLAKEGKDPGPTKVAEGKPAPVVKPEAAKPEAAKPATSEPAKAQGAVPALNQDVQKNLELVKAALQKQGMNDPKYIAATLGNVMKETGGKSVSENMDYSKTSNERIKKIFGSRAEGKTDKELDTIKKDPKQMGEMMYGNKTKMGQQMGNTEPGDGFKYRGRGFIQLTGKSNYAAASKAIYGDNRLVDNPDLVNDPAVAAEVSAWYMKKGQARMATSLGIDTKNMTQDQANLLATSQIAGGDIRKKGAIGQELAGKVDKFAGSSQIQAIAAAPSGPATASATPKPPVTSTATAAEAAKAAKARADFAANDPRRAAMAADVKPVEAKPVEAKPVEAKPVEAKPVEAKPVEAKPLTAVGTNVAPKIDETETPQSAMQTLIKDGIIPTTIAFQSLIKNGITPMLSSVQVKPVKAEPVKVEVPKVEPVKAQPVDLGSYEQTLAASTKAIIDTAKLPQPTDQSLAVKESLTSTANNLITGGKAMISGFQTTALDLSSSFINGLDLTTSNLTSSLTTSFQDGLSSNLDLFNTGFSNNFEMIGDTFASTFEKLDPFTENILSAAGHISDAENNIAENQKNIVLAQSELADADISDDRREQLNDFIQVAQENIGMQNSSMAYNKDAMNANIMARAESPKSEIIAQKEKEMQEQIAMEKQQAENREQLRKQEMVAMNDSASNQNTALGDSSDLNTALRELIAINKRTADLNEKQLSVQSSLSGDLFA